MFGGFGKNVFLICEFIFFFLILNYKLVSPSPPAPGLHPTTEKAYSSFKAYFVHKSPCETFYKGSQRLWKGHPVPHVSIEVSHVSRVLELRVDSSHSSIDVHSSTVTSTQRVFHQYLIRISNHLQLSF